MISYGSLKKMGVGLFSLFGFFYLDSGNFFRMRKIAYTEFRLNIRMAEIDPKLFSGPAVDFTHEDELVFKWCLSDSISHESYCKLVYVPPYFSTFRTEVRGSGSLELFRRAMGSKKN